MSTAPGIGYGSRNELISELKLRLADGMTDVELDSAHYHVAIKLAVQKYRQRSGGAVEESFIFIHLSPDVQSYVLPDEVVEVRRLYRRGIGTATGSGINFDPFDVAFNNMYMLQAGQSGGLALFDAFAQYKETVGRIFGSELDFEWRGHTKTLVINRKVTRDEEVGVTVYNYVPEAQLLKDIYASDWIAAYSLAQSKLMLGEARSKYTSGLPGAGGAIQLNGDILKQEAAAELAALNDAINNFEEGNRPLGFVIG